MPKLSVITINLNNAYRLQKTIESLICQSWRQYEFIIIDGGSTDDSLEVIKKYSEHITYFTSEADNGIYHAMNKGIVKALGEYCFFLNSGDYLADSRVFEKVFETNPAEEILFGNLYVTIKDKVIGKAHGKKNLTFSDIYANTIKHQASFIKRNLFETFGLYNDSRKIIADWEFFIKTVGLGNASYRFVDFFITYFDNDGLSNRNPEIARTERAFVIQENIPLLMQADYDFLLKYRQFETIYRNKFSFFVIRVLNKFLN